MKNSTDKYITDLVSVSVTLPYTANYFWWLDLDLSSLRLTEKLKNSILLYFYKTEIL